MLYSTDLSAQMLWYRLRILNACECLFPEPPVLRRTMDYSSGFPSTRMELLQIDFPISPLQHFEGNSCGSRLEMLPDKRNGTGRSSNPAWFVCSAPIA